MTGRWVEGSIAWSPGGWIDRSMDPWIDGCFVDRWIDVSMGRWIDGSTGRRNDGSMDRWANGILKAVVYPMGPLLGRCVVGSRDRSMDRWMERWSERCIDRGIDGSRGHVATLATIWRSLFRVLGAILGALGVILGAFGGHFGSHGGLLGAHSTSQGHFVEGSSSGPPWL